MFYANFVLTKKGPLARIWLAAHWDKKLTKAHVFETDIQKSVEAIIEPKVKMALRTSGHLLLGVVRIYSRKAKYLLADCNEAFMKIKMAFRPGQVDLPEENLEAAINTITLPETFHDFEASMADISAVPSSFALNQSRPEEITIREDFGGLSFMADDRFGLGGLDTFGVVEAVEDYSGIEAARHRESMSMIERPASALEKRRRHEVTGTVELGEAPRHLPDLEEPMHDDGFGGRAEVSGLPSLGDLTGTDQTIMAEVQEHAEGGEAELPTYGGEAAPSALSPLFEDLFDTDLAPPSVRPERDMRPPPSEVSGMPSRPPTATPAPPVAEQTPLVVSRDEAFALEPLEPAAIVGYDSRRGKRKRRLVVDEQKSIPSEVMKSQLADTSDIVARLDLAPPTRKLMRWKETGMVDRLMTSSARPITSATLGRLVQRQLQPHAGVSDADAADTMLTTSSFLTELRASLTMTTGQPLAPMDVIEEESELRMDTIGEASEEIDTGPLSVGPPSPSKRRSQPAKRAQPRVSQPQPVLPLPSVPSALVDLGGAEFPTLADTLHLDFSMATPQPLDVTDLGRDVAQPTVEAVDDLVVATGGAPEMSMAEAEEEEQRWSRRTKELIGELHRHFRGHPGDFTVPFSNLVARNSGSKAVVAKFYSMLILCKMNIVTVDQSESYGPIHIGQGARFQSSVTARS